MLWFVAHKTLSYQSIRTKSITIQHGKYIFQKPELINTCLIKPADEKW